MLSFRAVVAHALKWCLVLSACAGAPRVGKQATGASEWQREVARVTLNQLAVDSICATACSVLAVDTGVRGASSEAVLDVARLPVVARLASADLLATRSSRRVVASAFALGLGPVPDTMRVVLAVASPTGPKAVSPSTATVTATMLTPGSMGLLARAELVVGAHGWEVSSLRYFEP